MTRIAAITGNTLTDLTRQKVFYFLLIFALILIGSSVFLARFTFQQEFQILKDVSLGAMSIFTSLLAILAAARLIPQDIEDRTIYTILAKPVPRFEYVLGKLAGVLLLLAISMVVMSALFFAVLYAREQSLLEETWRQMSNAPRDQIDEALRAVRAAAFKIDIVSVIAVTELAYVSMQVRAQTFRVLEMLTAMAVLYWLLGYPQAKLVDWMQRRMKVTE